MPALRGSSGGFALPWDSGLWHSSCFMGGMIRFSGEGFRAAWVVFAVFGAGFLARAQPIAVKVAVVTTFEVGQDTGDAPGEFQFWAEREKWTRQIKVPGVDHPVYVNDDGVIGVVSGTTVRAGTPSLRSTSNKSSKASRAWMTSARSSSCAKAIWAANTGRWASRGECS